MQTTMRRFGRAAAPVVRRRSRAAVRARVSSALASHMAHAPRQIPAQPVVNNVPEFELAFDRTAFLRHADRDAEQQQKPAATTPATETVAATATNASEELPVFQRQCSLLDVVSDWRVLKAVSRVKAFGLPHQMDGRLPTPTTVDGNIASEADVTFCGKSLDKVSRSFAAVIRQLPPSLAMPTCVFYLVLRALDTVEDEMDFGKFAKASAQTQSFSHATVGSDPLLFKTSCLLTFHHLLHDTEENTNQWEALRALNKQGVGDGKQADQELLQEFKSVVRVFRDHCTPEQQDVIADITNKMAQGMAEYCQRNLGVDGTNSKGDYNTYCHIVAGLVGEGLSRLWGTVQDSGLPATSIDALNARTGLGSLSSDMGLFLQKANIIRDYSEDQVDGRAFWPKDVWAKFSPTGSLGAFYQPSDAAAFHQAEGIACLNTMVNDALTLAPSCFQYLAHLAPGDSRILRFCAIPQVMALCTLEECYGNPNVFRGVVKTPRTQSARICCEVGDMEGVMAWYRETCDSLERKVAKWEVSPEFDLVRDAPVAQQTRERVLMVRHAADNFEKEMAAQQQRDVRQDKDDDDDIPENWPCGPHAEAALMEQLLGATR